MKILVTGGAGYIGTELIHLLAQNDEVKEIIVYDNLSRPNYNLFLGFKPYGHKKIRFVKAELLDTRRLRKELDGADVVYHLAAKVATPFSTIDSHLYEQVNHWGTAELVYAVEDSSVRKLIYLSSTGVYGASAEPLDETASPEPKSFYAVSKVRGEEHVKRLQDRAYIVRCSNVYGYNKSMRFDSVINKFVFEANFDKRITIHGKGDQSRPFIHINFVGLALANLIKTDLEPGIYNLLDRSLKVLDIVDVLKQLIPKLEFIFIDQHIKLHELNIKVNEEVNQKLGIINKRSFKDEIQEFVEKFSF